MREKCNPESYLIFTRRYAPGMCLGRVFVILRDAIEMFLRSLKPGLLNSKLF